jgi:hypothetical protein
MGQSDTAIADQYLRFAGYTVIDGIDQKSGSRL